jgi:hypothetical protein
MEKVYLLKAENPHALLEVLTKSDATGGYEIDEIGFDDPALVHLRRLTEGGCKELDADRESVCRWCRSSTTFEDADGRRHFLHEPDCAFAHALDFLDQLNTPTAEQHR